ncbi:MAG: hypothetical protein PHX70_06110 [Clostridium sp.]|nr:hypothetical protein [Clostridium sp.]
MRTLDAETLKQILKEELEPIKIKLNEIDSIKEEINSIKEELGPIKTKLNQIDSIKEELKPIKAKLDETYEIVRALEHSSQVNKAEHDKITNDIAHISGHIKNIDENIGAVKDIIGRHEVDITVLKRRPV